MTERSALPDHPGTVTPDSAERFIRAYKRAVVYNELLPGRTEGADAGVEIKPGGCVGVRSITVDEPTTCVLLTDGPGVYVAGASSGHAEYACPGNRSASTARNRNFVTHYVGPDRHVALPYNFYQCVGREEPYAGPRGAENVALDADGDGYREGAPLKVHLYDFHPDTHALAVWLTHVTSGDRVLSETYTTDPPLTVVANLAVRTGTYRLVARPADGTGVTHEFDVPGSSASTWDGTCVYLALRMDLRAVTVDSTEALGIPGSRCHDSLARERATTAR